MFPYSNGYMPTEFILKKFLNSLKYKDVELVDNLMAYNSISEINNLLNTSFKYEDIAQPSIMVWESSNGNSDKKIE